MNVTNTFVTTETETKGKGRGKGKVAPVAPAAAPAIDYQAFANAIVAGIWQGIRSRHPNELGFRATFSAMVPDALASEDVAQVHALTVFDKSELSDKDSKFVDRFIAKAMSILRLGRNNVALIDAAAADIGSDDSVTWNAGHFRDAVENAVAEGKGRVSVEQAIAGAKVKALTEHQKDMGKAAKARGLAYAEKMADDGAAIGMSDRDAGDWQEIEARIVEILSRY